MRIFILILLLISGSAVLGQNKQLLYNFDGLPQNLMSNPGGETTFDMHFGIPLLSHFYFSAGSSGITMFDIFNTHNSINDNIEEILPEISNKEFFNIHEEMEILSFGWRGNEKRYFSAGIYQELDAFLYVPKSIAVLVYEGNRDYLNHNFSFSDVAFTAEVLNVFHIGFTNYYSENLNYGFRAKLYSSVFNSRSVQNRGVFRTSPSPDGANIYRHYVSGMDVMIHTSGFAPLIDSENVADLQTLQDLGRKAFLGGNLGVGLDAGFTFYLNDHTRFTGSVIDFGFINYNKDVENYHYYGSYVTDGIELTFPDPGEPRPAYWDIWEEDLDRHLLDETTHESYLAWRPVKLNASVDYGFNENLEEGFCYKPRGRIKYFNYIGFHLFSIKRPKGFLHAATLSFDHIFSKKYRGKITYTANSYSFSNIGLLFSGQFGNFNMYLGLDNLLSYGNLAKAHNLSVQFGMQFLITGE